MPNIQRIQAIDSHTAGEPTRVVLTGIPDLGPGSLADQCLRFRDQHDRFRSLVVNEPRGSDILVGALLVPPANPNCQFGVIFFNNVGVLNMCGHGTIGLAVTLRHLGKITPGEIRIDTPVGVVTATLHDDHRVTVRNVPSYLHRADVAVDVPGFGRVVGDIAWGGNWFYLVSEHQETLEVTQAEKLVDVTWRIRKALESQGITGANGGEIDHIELFGPPGNAGNHSRNFVLCPGKAYDRSPCGTGTSAKLACLAARGKLKPGQVWRQEGILGTVFEGQIEESDNGAVLPHITGEAYITAELTLIREASDPMA